jgi:hypothetical protein
MSQLSMGMKVETEHRHTVDWLKKMCKKGKCPSDKEVFKHISKDHIAEHKDYYTKLKTLKL